MCKKKKLIFNVYWHVMWPLTDTREPQKCCSFIKINLYKYQGVPATGQSGPAAKNVWECLLYFMYVKATALIHSQPKIWMIKKVLHN